jgi:hypothetical protein
MAGGTYVAYTLNLLGPMMSMANAASQQAVEIGKERLRDFLENNETARQALSMPARASDGISLHTLDSSGKKKEATAEQDDDNI